LVSINVELLKTPIFVS